MGLGLFHPVNVVAELFEPRLGSLHLTHHLPHLPPDHLREEEIHINYYHIWTTQVEARLGRHLVIDKPFAESLSFGGVNDALFEAYLGSNYIIT